MYEKVWGLILIRWSKCRPKIGKSKLRFALGRIFGLKRSHVGSRTWWRQSKNQTKTESQSGMGMSLPVNILKTYLTCTCKPTSVLRVFMVWWFFCLSLHAHSDSEGDGKTLSWLRQQVSYTSLYPCSRWRGRIQTLSIIVSACTFRWRKKELSNTQV